MKSKPLQPQNFHCLPNVAFVQSSVSIDPDVTIRVPTHVSLVVQDYERSDSKRNPPKPLINLFTAFNPKTRGLPDDSAA